MNRILFHLKSYVNKIWVRCLLACIIATSAFFGGPYFQRFLPDSFDRIVSKDGLANILEILASSMLAVSIFSLSILVQAFSSAANNASPRANSIMMDNASSNNALGTFIAAFLFSITGLIGIRSNYYNDEILNLLFILTIGLIALIIIVFLSWIDQVVKLGRVRTTIGFVEKALHDAIDTRINSAAHLCSSIAELQDRGSFEFPIFFKKLGHIQYIDYEDLKDITLEEDIDILLDCYPGSFVTASAAKIFTRQPVSEDVKDKIRKTFVLDSNRTFSQDPRYGFIVLAEIALRALSPAVNDPGTAVDVMGAQLTALHRWIDQLAQLQRDDDEKAQAGELEKSSKYSRIYTRTIEGDDILEDIFGQLIIDASHNLIMTVRIRKALNTIQDFNAKDFSPHAQYWLDLLHERCKNNFSDIEMKRIFGDDS